MNSEEEKMHRGRLIEMEGERTGNRKKGVT